MTKAQALREIGLTESEVVDIVLRDELLEKSAYDEEIAKGYSYGKFIGVINNLVKYFGHKRLISKITSSDSNAVKEFGKDGAKKYARFLTYKYKEADSTEERKMMSKKLFKNFFLPTMEKYKINVRGAVAYLNSTIPIEKIKKKTKYTKYLDY